LVGTAIAQVEILAVRIHRHHPRRWRSSSAAGALKPGGDAGLTAPLDY
jgi:hypothetical protein